MRIPVKPKVHKVSIEIRNRPELAEFVRGIKFLRSRNPGVPKSPCEQFCDEDIWERTRVEPIFFENVSLGLYHAGEPVNYGYLYQNAWYLVEGKFTREQKKLLIMEHADRERIYFENLAKKFTSDAAREAMQPVDRIPKEVKIAVWRRDEGRCADCKERERLEYHHIIPRSKGGSSSVRNVELLCETCNRKRGNRIDELPLTF
jgi:hypothetical protein